MESHNQLEERIWIFYEDAKNIEIPEKISCADNPETKLIAAEELNLVIRLANENLKPEQANAIILLAAGQAYNHADAARAAGITQVQLHRGIRLIKQLLDSLSA